MSVVETPRWPTGWRIAEARTHRDRRRGLLGRERLDGDEGLWLPVRSVHTVGMRFALDLLWLERGGGLRRIDRAVSPGRLRGDRRAAGGVVEVAAGRGSLLGVAILLAAAGGAAHEEGSHPDHDRHPGGGDEVGTEAGEGHRTIVRTGVARTGAAILPGAGGLPWTRFSARQRDFRAARVSLTRSPQR
ncbi:DUF192 domain-containing protein [Patulibacter defluvii]|uniref:DUF192 domain-containing protein n=1 Tax=Patulibacter defluvii TaxID=3095358 RepID=UPI002A7488A0|nr:DUF192 domain-containing protein [Patulibacter sp. DM4]